jgi:hypothetical protein
MPAGPTAEALPASIHLEWLDTRLTAAVRPWLKIKNPNYSQAEGRPELFEAKRSAWRPPRTKAAPPALALR